MKVFKSLIYILKLIFLLVITSVFNKMYNINNQFILIIEYFLLMIIIVYPFIDEIFKDYRSFHLKKTLKKNIKPYIIGFILMCLTNAFIVYFIYYGIAPNEEQNRLILKSMPIYSIIVMCIITPIIEETTFRKAFTNAFTNKKTSIIVTALLFGFMHVILSLTKTLDLVFIIPYTILGLTFSYIYFNDKNIFSSITFHIIHNTLSIIIILLTIV